MKIDMDLSEVLLFLDLIKEQKRSPSIEELKLMLYYLKNYEEVREFSDKLEEHGFRPPFKFYNGSLIHFIEDYDDCNNLKSMILQTTRRQYSVLFRHQILLSQTEAQANDIINEAKENGIELSETWSTRYNSMWQIKSDQQAWKSLKYEYDKFFYDIYNDYCNLRLKYFDGLSIKHLTNNYLEDNIMKNNLKQIRKIKGITQKELAENLNVSKAMISMWENNSNEKMKNSP